MIKPTDFGPWVFLFQSHLNGRSVSGSKSLKSGLCPSSNKRMSSNGIPHVPMMICFSSWVFSVMWNLKPVIFFFPRPPTSERTTSHDTMMSVVALISSKAGSITRTSKSFGLVYLPSVIVCENVSTFQCISNF